MYYNPADHFLEVLDYNRMQIDSTASVGGLRVGQCLWVGIRDLSVNDFGWRSVVEEYLLAQDLVRCADLGSIVLSSQLVDRDLIVMRYQLCICIVTLSIHKLLDVLK